MPLIKVRGPAKAPPGSYAFFRARSTVNGAVAAEGLGADAIQRSTVRGAVAARPLLFARSTVNGAVAARWEPRALSTVKGALAGSELTGTVTFPNGYAHRRRVIIPKESNRAGADIAGFILLIEHTDPDWRSVANGGQVQSASGHDIRLELVNGTVLAFERDAYDPATGALRLWVKLPALSATASTELFVYHGKAGAADEQNAAGTWSAYMAVWNARTGVDRTGQGRTLTPANVAAGTLIGDAGDYNGTTSAAETTTTPLWLDGLAAIHVQAFASWDASPASGAVLTTGPNPGSDDTVLGLLLSANDGTPNKSFVAKVNTSAGASRVVSAGDLHAAGTWFMLAVQWQSGQAAKLFVGDPVKGGGFIAPSNTPAAMTGATAVGAGRQLRLGTARQPSGRWLDGRADEVRISAAIPSEGHLRTELANYTQPALFMGIGNARAAQQVDNPPVAVPDLATIAADQAQIDIDVLANDFEPETADAKVLTSVSGAGFSVVDGKVRFTKPSGFTGPAYATYLLTAGTKSCAAGIRVDLVAGTATGFQDDPTVPLVGVHTFNKKRGWNATNDAATEPGSGRGFNIGVMAVVGNDLDGVNDALGFKCALQGGRAFKIDSKSFLADSWPKVTGVNRNVSATGVVSWSDLAASQGSLQYQNNSADWLAKNARMASWGGWYYYGVASFPMNSPTSIVQDVIDGEYDTWYEKWGDRVRRSIEAAGQDPYKLILRWIYEHNQDTAARFAGGVKIFEVPGMTLDKFKNFNKKGIVNFWKGFGIRVPVALSPAYESTFNTNINNLGELTTQSGDATKRRHIMYKDQLIDEMAVCCGSYHPVDFRVRTRAQAISIVTRGATAEGELAEIRYGPATIIRAARETGRQAAFLEHSVGLDNATFYDESLKYACVSYDEFGKLLHANADIVFGTGMLGSHMIRDAKPRSNIDATEWANLAKVTRHHFGRKNADGTFFNAMPTLPA